MTEADNHNHQDFDPDQAFKDYAREPVPEHALRPSWRLFAIWFAVLINLPFMMTGAVFGQQLSLTDAIVAILLGQALVSLLIGLSGYIGTRTRLSNSIMLPQVYGRGGAKFLTALIALSVLGWFGFQAEIFAETLQRLVKTQFDTQLPLAGIKILGGIVMTSTAVIGFRAMDWLSQVAIPLMFILLLIPFFDMMMHDGWKHVMATSPSGEMSIGQAISMLVGGIALGMLIAPDFTRYVRSGKGAVHAIWTSQLFGTGLIVFFAYFLTQATGETDIVPMLISLGWAMPILIVMILATWTTNDGNIYIASLNLTGIIPRLRKWQLAVICGAIGIIFSLIGIKANFVPFLSLLGIVFAPAGAVFIIDYFRGPDRYIDAHAKQAPVLRIFPCLAWLAGIMLGWLTTPAESLGAGLFTMTGTPALDGIIMAGIVYLFLQICRKNT